MRLGALLPHFGQWADKDRILDGARRLEDYGFDSVWVRDHLLFTPHEGMEHQDRCFLEALTVLTAVGSVTERIALGTGTLIPTRHPLHVAQIVGTMTHMVGDRVIIGLGSGAFDHEFEAVGMGGIRRSDLVTSYMKILRETWTRDGVSFSDEQYRFDDVALHPKPKRAVPIWYCGNSPASVRRAAHYCDGWMPGRISLPTLEKRIELLDEICSELGRPRPSVAAIPATSVASSPDKALESVNVGGLLSWANKSRYWVRPPTGSFETVYDLQGVLIAGCSDDVVEACGNFRRLGTDHLVFDLRFGFDRWFEQIDLLGKEVLPAVRRETAETSAG